MHFRLRKVWSLENNFILRVSMVGKESYQLNSQDFDADFWKCPSVVSVTDFISHQPKFFNYQACFKV